jgi:hypothetical protein
MQFNPSFYPIRVVIASALILVSQAVIAQETGKLPANKGVRYGEEEEVQRWQVGIEVHAIAECRGIFATAPIPTNWPEQRVEIVEEDLSPEVRDLKYRVLDNGVKQMMVSIPRLAAGKSAHALVTVEVRRKRILPPENELALDKAKKLPKEVRKFLAASPYIETRNPKIRALAKKLSRDVPATTPAWKQVELIYDWVRDNVQYENGKLKGAAAALRDGTGDCEELTSLFIALCRLNKIPARTVWVPNHCYPEFYLEDDYGNGYWIPCQAAGTRDFGSMPDTRPVLQKGDNFDVPELRGKKQRFVAEYLKVAGALRQPRVNFVRKTVAVGDKKKPFGGFRGF